MSYTYVTACKHTYILLIRSIPKYLAKIQEKKILNGRRIKILKFKILQNAGNLNYVLENSISSNNLEQKIDSKTWHWNACFRSDQKSSLHVLLLVLECLFLSFYVSYTIFFRSSDSNKMLKTDVHFNI